MPLKRANILAGGLAVARPANCAIAAASVAVGAVTSGAGTPGVVAAANPDVILAALSAALITGAGNSYNDLVDLEIDRINRPSRPLPSGRLQPRGARQVSAFLALLGLGLAWWVGSRTGVIASVVVVGLVVYSVALKTRPLWGNLLVSALAAAAFPFGAAAAGAWGRSWIPAGFALLFHLGREIVKDIEDMAGDRVVGARTLALALGARRAGVLSAAIFCLLVASTAIPWSQEIYGWAYLAPVGVLDLLVIGLMVQLLRLRGAISGHGLSRALTRVMGIGLLAILLGETL